MARPLVLQASVLAMLALSSVLAGCSSSPDPLGAESTGPCVVTGPTDTRCDAPANATASAVAQPHLHDYWGGQTRITVLEETKPSPVGYAGLPVRIARFRPEPGHVVPQGTAYVELTLGWTTQSDDLVSDFEVRVKTAGTTQFVSLGHPGQGGTVQLNTSQPDNDLPHQAMSGWLVDVYVEPEANTGTAHYYGDVTIKLEAIRGTDPIPLYPGHPDQWFGRSEIALVDHSQNVTFFGNPDSTFYGCGGNGTCLQVLRPDFGALVPQGTATVEVDLTWTGEPLALGLKFHRADDDQFMEATASLTEPGHRHFSLLVDPGTYDGPYAKQSLWEFLPFITGPYRDGAFAGTLQLTASAVHE